MNKDIARITVVARDFHTLSLLAPVTRQNISKEVLAWKEEVEEMGLVGTYRGPSTPKVESTVSSNIQGEEMLYVFS